MNISKAKLAGGALVAVFGVLAVASMVGAQSAVLSVSCSGAVTNNVVTWTASAANGTAPYVFAWSGDPSVAGSASTSIVATYPSGTTATYTADIQVTDASSTVATSTCSATVTAVAVPSPTSTLNVFVAVNNTAGGSAVPSSFTVTVAGANASPSPFTGSNTGIAVTLNANSAYTVTVSSLANYTASMSGNCTGPIATGGTASCTVTETYAPSSTTPPPPAPRVNPPSLTIGPNGAFLARGMTVTSVGTNSFQASVWGITYTVNWSGALSAYGPFEFWFRYQRANATTTPTQQLAVGDEVGVSGTVASGTPLTVNANVVRDYSITMPRPVHTDNGIGNGGVNNGNGNAQGRLNDLMNQLKGLQDLFRGRFGGNH